MLDQEIKYAEKKVVLTLNGRTVVFDPTIAEWIPQKQPSQYTKKLESGLRTNELRIKQLNRDMQQNKTEMVSLKQSLMKQKTEKERLDKVYQQKIEVYKSLKITKDMIQQELKKGLSKRI